MCPVIQPANPLAPDMHSARVLSRFRARLTGRGIGSCSQGCAQEPRELCRDCCESLPADVGVSSRQPRFSSMRASIRDIIAAIAFGNIIYRVPYSDHPSAFTELRSWAYCIVDRHPPKSTLRRVDRRQRKADRTGASWCADASTEPRARRNGSCTAEQKSPSQGSAPAGAQSGLKSAQCTAYSGRRVSGSQRSAEAVRVNPQLSEPGAAGLAGSNLMMACQTSPVRLAHLKAGKPGA